jgi:hypothetical protein
MKGSAARIAYCVGLFVLAACAVVPRPRAPVLIATVISDPLSTEGRLAGAIAERISIEASGDIHAYRLDELTGEIAGLRRLAFEDDALGARQELVDALADQLSAALARRGEIASSDNTTDLRVTDAIIRSLTAAINAEVHGLGA